MKTERLKKNFSGVDNCSSATRQATHMKAPQGRRGLVPMQKQRKPQEDREVGSKEKPRFSAKPKEKEN